MLLRSVSGPIFDGISAEPVLLFFHIADILGLFNVMTDCRAFRILITRLSAIGDCILTLPILNALRDRYPNAFLAWVVESSTAPLLQDHPALDKIIVAPRAWLKRRSEILNLRRQLRNLKFDISVDPQSLTKSSLLARLSGAPRRIGFGGKNGREISRFLNNEHVEASKPHIVDRSLELIRPLGVCNPDVRFDLPLYAASAEMASVYVRSGPLRDGFVIFNMGAGWKSKIWPPERYAAVAEFLGKSYSLSSLVLWAGDEEKRRAEICAERSNGHAIVAPPTSLTDVASLTRHAQLFVGSDTGPLHLAAAVGTPCLGLYGVTRPRDCGPYGRQHRALQRCYQAGGSRERRTADNSAMCAISDQDVIAGCWQLMHSRQAA